ncbi:MAG: cytidine deaminase [Bacteroidota bacterium]|jgi:cytidine deaminase
MKKVSQEIQFELYDSSQELSQLDRELLEAAVASTDSAYAPYSKFHVGAAVLLETGEVVQGSNQENAAYPSGLCAERVALFAAASQHPENKICAIAITACFHDTDELLAVSPCGDCRQVLAEYEHRYQSGIRMILTAGNGKVMVVPDARTLLPLMFNADNLKRD